jgi:DNA-binding transcriptional MerR regulator
MQGATLEGWSSNAVSRSAGITLRQLQWWDERNLVCPAQTHGRRIYGPRELAEVRLIAALRQKKISLQKCHLIMGRLRRDGIRIDRNKTAYLVIDDHQRVTVENHPKRVCDVMARSAGPMILVEIPVGSAE